MARAQTPHRGHRRWLLALAGALAPLLLLELGLQVAAYAVWRTTRHAHQSAGEGPTILCAGDSFTHGLGATSDDGSYPMQLARELAARGVAARVVNGGWSGQDSGEVLARLEGQLAVLRPARVCILAGCNDRWRRPARWAPGRAARVDGFPWRWRTGRLLALAMQPRSKEPRDAAVLLGPWHDDVDEVTFHADGRLMVSGLPFRWRVKGGGGSLLVRIPPVPEEGEVAWRVAGDTLELECALWARGLRLRRGPRPEGPDAVAVHAATLGMPASEDEVRDVLHAHLVQAVALCRAHDAEPILLTYPESGAVHHEIVRGVASTLSARWIDLTAPFADALARRPRAELLVPDGHCTDAGYGLMARTIAEALAGR